MSSQFNLILFLATFSLASSHIIDTLMVDDVSGMTTTQLPLGTGKIDNKEGSGSLPQTLSPPSVIKVEGNDGQSSNPLPELPSSSTLLPVSTSLPLTSSTTESTPTAPSSLPPSTTASLSPSSLPSSTPIQTPTAVSLNQIESNSSNVVTGHPTVPSVITSTSTTTSTTTTTTVKPRPAVSFTTQPPTVKPAPVFPVPLAKDPIGVKLYLYTRFHSHAPYMLDANSIDSLKGRVKFKIKSNTLNLNHSLNQWKIFYERKLLFYTLNSHTHIKSQ